MTDAEKTVAKTAEEIAAEVEKSHAEAAQALAEARKADAEAEAKASATAAEVAKAQAEAKKAESEAAYFAAQTRREIATAEQEECELYVTKINRDIQDELRKRQLAHDSYHHVYRFVGTVGDKTVEDCIHELSYWNRSCPKCDITIIFYSPGGSVIPGMALYDFIRSLSNEGHSITTMCAGYAASMAGILLQAGDTRIIGKESYILIHEISAATHGKMGEMKDDVKFYEHICKRVVDIFVNRSGGKLTKSRMTKEWVGHDWWIDSDLALTLGIVDEVR
jgi:ATP-dependent Clp endopeptidase proteolytic subunit ClpP